MKRRCEFTITLPITGESLRARKKRETSEWLELRRSRANQVCHERMERWRRRPGPEFMGVRMDPRPITAREAFATRMLTESFHRVVIPHDDHVDASLCVWSALARPTAEVGQVFSRQLLAGEWLRKQEP